MDKLNEHASCMSQLLHPQPTNGKNTFGQLPETPFDHNIVKRAVHPHLSSASTIVSHAAAHSATTITP
jgi:hypothetical protein